jgi:hypothetical protein
MQTSNHMHFLSSVEQWHHWSSIFCPAFLRVLALLSGLFNVISNLI